MTRLLENARHYLEAYRWRRVTGILPLLSRSA
jgi:hypothetical protein